MSRDAEYKEAISNYCDQLNNEREWLSKSVENIKEGMEFLSRKLQFENKSLEICETRLKEGIKELSRLKD